MNRYTLTVIIIVSRLCSTVQVFCKTIMKSQVSPGSASLACGLSTKASRAPVRRSSWGLRTNAVRAQAHATATAIENATATTTNHMSEPTVGKAAPVKPTEYNYTKQMKPGNRNTCGFAPPTQVLWCQPSNGRVACWAFAGPYRMTMGLEPMNPADWMEIDSLYEEEMQLRREILEDKRHLVVACQPCVSCAHCFLQLAVVTPAVNMLANAYALLGFLSSHSQQQCERCCRWSPNICMYACTYIIQHLFLTEGVPFTA